MENGQLSGTATGTVNGQTVTVAGALTYTSAAGTVLDAGNGQSEAVTFTGRATTTVQAKVAPTTVSMLAQGNAWLPVEKPPQQRVLESAHALLAVTGLTESQLAAPLHVGSIDWKTQMVALVSTGFGAIGASSAQANITNLTAENNTLIVHWQWLKPNPNQVIPDFLVLTNPFEFVLVNRFTGRVRFYLDSQEG